MAGKPKSTISTGCGCLFIGLVGLGFFIVMTGNANRRAPPPQQNAAPAPPIANQETLPDTPLPKSNNDRTSKTESQRWTKTNTPEWVHKLPTKVSTAFNDMMTDKSPLYTGIECDGKSTKVYVNRAEWKKLTKFQATNNLMLAVLLPHTDDTVIEYIDDKSKRKLATFTAKQNTASIKVLHP